MSGAATDLLEVLRDTVRESVRSWRLPAALTLGIIVGLAEKIYTGHALGLVFGPLAALHTLLLGPLPWRVLTPLEADGHRVAKFVRGLAAAGIALFLFALLVAPYVFVVRTWISGSVSALEPRVILLSSLLFLVGGWGLARDVQLEQRLDRTLRRHGDLAAELEQARLHALRADLDPHFLFNALNAIASQCITDPRRAEDNIVRLSSLLRAVLDTRRQPLHALADELSLARDYLGLLGARFPQLRYTIDVPAELAETVGVPPLLLQPLLENAVRHGELTSEAISITAQRSGDGLCIAVRSPGVFRGPREGGMGLELVRKRVGLAWGEQGRFEIGTDGTWTLAQVVFPRPSVRAKQPRNAA